MDGVNFNVYSKGDSYVITTNQRSKMTILCTMMMLMMLMLMMTTLPHGRAVKVDHQPFAGVEGDRVGKLYSLEIFSLSYCQLFVVDLIIIC